MLSKRGKVIYMTLPKRPNAPKGICRWCGATLIGSRAKIRRFCYPDREGRNCVKEFHDSMTYSTRDALRKLAQRRGETELKCVDCGLVVEILHPHAAWPKMRLHGWDADHDIPLWEGGTHTIENLRIRCAHHHKAKTAAEATRRAHASTDS